MSATIDTWTGRFGLLAGFLLVATWLAFAGRPGMAPAPAASVRVTTLVSGELSISPPTQAVLNGHGLRPGGEPKTGSLRVRNQTPVALGFALRAQSPEHDLDRSLWIEVTDGEDTLVRTTLGRARAWSPEVLRLRSGQSRELEVRAWIPEDAPDGWQAGRAGVILEFSSIKGRRS